MKAHYFDIYYTSIPAKSGVVDRKSRRKLDSIRRRTLSLDRKKSILARALPLKKQNSEFLPQVILRAVFDIEPEKHNYWFCRRYLANFGGFVSFSHSVSGEEEESPLPSYSNGYSFFNRFGGQGWTFLSKRDLFPLDLFALNKKFKGLLNNDCAYPARPTLMLTESYNPVSAFLQPRNFARTYRPRFAHDFAWAFDRSSEVFDHFYNLTKVEPLIVARHPAANFLGGGFLAFSKKDLEINSLFRNKHSSKKYLFRAESDSYRTIFSYDKIYSMMASEVLKKTIKVYFDGWGDYLIKPANDFDSWFKYAEKAPLWLKFAAIKNFRSRDYFIDKFTSRDKGEFFSKIMPKLNASRRALMKTGVAAPSAVFRRFSEALYNHSSFLLESGFTGRYVGKESGFFLDRTPHAVISPKIAYGDYKFWPRQIKWNRRGAKRNNKFVNQFRELRQVSLPLFFSNISRDLCGLGIGRALSVRKKARIFARRLRGRRTSIAKGSVAIVRRLRSPYKRRRMFRS